MDSFKGVRIQNVGLFRDQKITLPPSRLVVLVGPNGTGKTTALECLAAAAYRVLDGRSEEASFQYHQRLRARISERVTPKVSGLFGRAEVRIYPSDEFDGVEKYLDLHRQKPVVVRYYPITRGFPHRSPRRVQGMILDDEVGRLPGPREIDATAQNLGTPAEHLKQWLVNQYFLRHEPEYGPIHQKRFRTFVEVLERFFGGLGGRPYLKFERVGRDFEVWFRTPTGDCRLEDLAAGVQSVLSIMADLIIHLDSAYPDSTDSLAEPAIVFIDEVELHLHPAWQQTAAQVLLESFPVTRFVMSTHSPLVVNDCDARSLLLFHFDDRGEVQVSPYSESMRGWLAEQIYVHAFGMPSSRNPGVQVQLDEFVLRFRMYLQLMQDGRRQEAADMKAQLSEMEGRLHRLLAPGDPALEILRFRELRDSAEETRHG